MQYNTGNVNNKAHLTLRLLHLHLCHSLHLSSSHASEFRLSARQGGDVPVNRAPVHTGCFGHQLLIQSLLVSLGLGKGVCPNQSSWIFMGSVQWLQLLL